uniref:Uncharacterized protein n=1 Tax=Romanomermis culicivorax TaxID=13658 RepID=A0A915JK55_ROMCU
MTKVKSEEASEGTPSDPSEAKETGQNWQYHGQDLDTQFYNPNFQPLGRCSGSQEGQNQGQDGGPFRHARDVVHPVDGKPHWEIAMQIDEMDDQRHRHLHRSGAPQKDQKMIILLSIVKAGGPKAQAPACSQQAAENSGDPTKPAFPQSSVFAGSNFLYSGGTEERLQQTFVCDILIHPEFSIEEESKEHTSSINNIALVKQINPIKFNEYVQPIPLTIDTIYQKNSEFLFATYDGE